MSKNKTSEAQLRASKKYNKKNRKELNIKDKKRRGLNFIENHAQEEDLQEYEQAIAERRKALKK